MQWDNRIKGDMAKIERPLKGRDICMVLPVVTTSYHSSVKSGYQCLWYDLWSLPAPENKQETNWICLGYLSMLLGYEVADTY